MIAAYYQDLRLGFPQINPKRMANPIADPSSTPVLKNAKMYLAELHPTDFSLLRSLFLPDGKYTDVAVVKRDGFKANLISHFRPISLSLIDPSYEKGAEYHDVAYGLMNYMRRWPRGIHLLWYPILHEKREELQGMLQFLRDHLHTDKALTMTQYDFEPVPLSRTILHAQLLTRTLPREEIDPFERDKYAPFRGMYGTGMIVANAPTGLRADLVELFAWLHSVLREGPRAGSYSVDDFVL